jgi:tetratricopeptide (TPR) repeat protein
VTHRSKLVADAQARAAEGDLSGALRLWREAARAEPDANILLEVGRTALRAGESEEGVVALEEALRLEPGLADAHFALGFFFESNDEPERALAHLRAGLDLREWQPALTMIGEVLRRLGRSGDAMLAFERSVELQPDDDEALYGLAVVCGASDADRALELLRKAIKAEPRNARAHAELGHLLLERGEPVEAEEAVRRALTLNDTDAWAHDYLGHVLIRRGLYREAESAFLRAIELWPEQPLFHCNHGDALWRQERLSEAESAYLRALEIDVSSYLANLRYGQLLNVLGDAARARTYLLRALAADPGNRRAMRALAELG